MSKSMSREKTHPVGQTKWDEAIQDAKVKIAQLKRSITIFKSNIKGKVPWPGDSATHN